MGGHTRAGHFLFLAAVASAAEYTVVDVQKIPVSGDASAAIVRAVINEPVAEITCDVLIAGAGMGGRPRESGRRCPENEQDPTRRDPPIMTAVG